jgi:purine-nucleoside phosphorylase
MAAMHDLYGTSGFDPATDPFRLAHGAALELQARAGGGPHEVAVILGSGWVEASVDLGEVDVEMFSSDIAGFAASTVPGHSNSIHSMWVGPRRVLLFLGRVHLYEGNPLAAVVHAVRTAIMAGCETVILTNAAGSINPDWEVGDGALITDHINLSGKSALEGSAPPEPYGSRFLDMTEVYSQRLRDIAKGIDPHLREGVYAALHGPNYETPAEIRMLRTMGADLVGMSTALEAMAARHLGAEVLGLSMVTNLAAGVSPEPLDHREVLAAGAAAGPRLIALIRQVIEAL